MRTTGGRAETRGRGWVHHREAWEPSLRSYVVAWKYCENLSFGRDGQGVSALLGNEEPQE